jgi:hypothetical protein
VFSGLWENLTDFHRHGLKNKAKILTDQLIERQRSNSDNIGETSWAIAFTVQLSLVVKVSSETNIFLNIH